MSGGTLEGSFINSNMAQDLNIRNGASVTANIHNLSSMRYLEVSGIQGSSTQIDGSIVNDGNLTRVNLMGSGSRVDLDILNSETGDIQQGIYLEDGASVGGQIINNGETGFVVVNNATVEKSITNNGKADFILVHNGGVVNGSVSNTFGAEYFPILK